MLRDLFYTSFTSWRPGVVITPNACFSSSRNCLSATSLAISAASCKECLKIYKNIGISHQRFSVFTAHAHFGAYIVTMKYNLPACLIKTPKIQYQIVLGDLPCLKAKVRHGKLNLMLLCYISSVLIFVFVERVRYIYPKVCDVSWSRICMYNNTALHSLQLILKMPQRFSVLIRT